MFASVSLLSALVGTVAAGSILWDGRFNDLTSSADLDKWSWSSQVGPYQYYIHGAGTVDKYVNLSPDFKNPADSGSSQGVKLTIDDTAHWNGQPMFRTELIPQTTAAINKGKVYYHFSLKSTGTNAPDPTQEHQVAFFESHFTELLYGTASGQTGSDNTLRWAVNKNVKWSAELKADEWHNAAYEIDFDANTVAFYHSTGAADLALVAGPVAASTSSNGQDWHLGILRLPANGASTGQTEDWYFSGVYIESGPITTKVSAAGGAAGADVPAGDAAATSSAPAYSSITDGLSASVTVSAPAGTLPAPDTPTPTSETPVVTSAAPAPPAETPEVPTPTPETPSTTDYTYSSVTLPPIATLTRFTGAPGVTEPLITATAETLLSSLSSLLSSYSSELEASLSRSLSSAAEATATPTAPAPAPTDDAPAPVPTPTDAPSAPSEPSAPSVPSATTTPCSTTSFLTVTRVASTGFPASSGFPPRPTGGYGGGRRRRPWWYRGGRGGRPGRNGGSVNAGYGAESEAYRQLLTKIAAARKQHQQRGPAQ